MGFDLVAIREGERVARREAVVGEPGGQLLQAHGEERRGEDPVEHGFGRLPAPAAAINVDGAVAEDCRLEERQTADVIEMEVAEKNVDLGRRARPERRAERREAGAGVNDEQAPAAADLNARGMTTELAET